MKWQPIETSPTEKTVLVQHEDDLYPVPAYRMYDAFERKWVWRRETEGPEDVFYGAERHCPLYRDPTHWRYLPNPPTPKPC